MNPRRCSSLQHSQLGQLSEKILQDMHTWNHRQAVAHRDQIHAIGCGNIRGSGVDWTVWETEGPSILADNSHVFPSKAFKALASNFAEGGREVNQVDLIEELVHWEESRHGFDVVPISGLAIETPELVTFCNINFTYPVPPPTCHCQSAHLPTVNHVGEHSRLPKLPFRT